MTIVDKILSELNLKASKFAKEISVHPTQIYDLQSGKTKSITPSMADKILAAYPQFSKLWLITGEGEMLNSYKMESNAELVGIAKAASLDELPMVRFFEVTPTATFQEFCAGMSEEPSMINIMPMHGEHVDDSYCAFEIYGESMAPQIQNGARVLCQEIRPTKWHTIRSGVVVIAYGNEFVIKRIIKNDLDQDNTLTLGSDNPY